MTTENTSIVTIATKVSDKAAAALDRIAERKGMTRYELIQMVIDTLIRYMDDRHNLTPEIERAMSLFEHAVGWKDALSLAGPLPPDEIGEATYYMVSHGGRRHGVRAVHVDRPFMGDWQETNNIQHILERTICLLMPERYRRLRSLAVDMDCNSLLELLDVMIDDHSKEEELRELRRDFEDDDRSEYGRKPVKQPYRRHNKKDMEKDDREWRPFGVEW